MTAPATVTPLHSNTAVEKPPAPDERDDPPTRMADDLQPAPPVPDSPRTKRTARRFTVAVLAVAFAIAGALFVGKRHRNDQTATLEAPVSTGEQVPIPALPPVRGKGVEVTAEALALGAPEPAVAAASPPAPEASQASGVIDRAQAAASSVVAQVKSMGDDVAKLIRGQHDLEDRISRIEVALAEIRDQMARPAPAASLAAPAPTAIAKPARATKRQGPVPTAQSSTTAPPEDAARLLAVDVWDGKPSVVVARGASNDLRFLNEGESAGRVTVRRADVNSQKAVFGTDKGDVVLSRDPQQ